MKETKFTGTYRKFLKYSLLMVLTIFLSYFIVGLFILPFLILKIMKWRINNITIEGKKLSLNLTNKQFWKFILKYYLPLIVVDILIYGLAFAAAYYYLILYSNLLLVAFILFNIIYGSYASYKLWAFYVSHMSFIEDEPKVEDKDKTKSQVEVIKDKTETKDIKHEPETQDTDKK